MICLYFLQILRGSLANGRWKAEIVVSEMTDMMQSGAGAMVVVLFTIICSRWKLVGHEPNSYDYGAGNVDPPAREFHDEDVVSETCESTNTPGDTCRHPYLLGVLRTWAAQLYTTLAPQVSGPIEHGYVFLLI